MYKFDRNNDEHRALVRSFLLKADPIGYYDPEGDFHNEYDYCITDAIELINLGVSASKAAQALLEKMLGSVESSESARQSDLGYFASEGFQSRLRGFIVSYQNFVDTL